MLSVLHEPLIFFTTFCLFVSWREFCFMKILKESKAKLIWPFPCHIVCTLFSYWFYHEILLNESMLEQDIAWKKLPAVVYTNTFSNTTSAYSFYFAYWCVTVYDFNAQTHKDSDYQLMKAHHFATLLSLITSDIFGFRRFGINILFLHDLSDIFIALLKITFKYKFSKRIVNTIYVICMFVWIVTRLILFGGYICIWLIWPEFIRRLFAGENLLQALPCLFLIVLLICNLRWTIMLLQLACKSRKSVISKYENKSKYE